MQMTRGALLGVWRGAYTCSQGETGVELIFTEVHDDGIVIGTFSFFNLPGHNNAQAGEYNLIGKYDPSQSKLQMSPGAWISQTPNYNPVGFSASFPLSGTRRILGTISHSGCGQIYADKTGN
jgi:hypothetical protein